MRKIIYLLFIILFSVSISCSKDDNSEAVENEDPTAANKKSVGTSSNDLLSDTTFKSMVIEVVYVEGFEPSQEAITNLVSFMQARTFKPNGITVEKRAIPSPGTSPHSNNEIRNIEDANRTKFNTDDQIAVWAFFADGVSANDSQDSFVLGTAYRNTSIVIYEGTLQDLSDETFEPDRTILESTVIFHEIGHILGLTNLGAPLQSSHEDFTHPKHCDVNSCLMFWKTETMSGVMDMVSGGEIPELDPQCLADLQANGGK